MMQLNAVAYYAEAIGGIKSTFALVRAALADRRAPVADRLAVAGTMLLKAFACAIEGHVPVLRTWRHSPRALFECARCETLFAILPRVI